MSNITLSINDSLLKACREYAGKQGMSLNALVRSLLERTVEQSQDDWLESCFHKMDEANGNSEGKTWRREELYDV